MNSQNDNIPSEEKWLSILEYCEYRNKSISTVRRYIKAENLTYKLEDGKYMILVRNYTLASSNEESLDNLNRELRMLKEENQELKMLVDLYEQKINFGTKSENDIIRQ
jgi:hypothetical protein